jgi:alkaline phosphatase D
MALTRRGFLSAAIATSLLGHAGCKGGDDDERVVEDGFELFPQSIASGDPRPDTVILWTRIEDPDAAEGDFDVELEMWVHDGEPSDVLRVQAVAEADFDHCVKLRVTGLEPGTTYGYRFVYLQAGGKALGSRTGTTRTAPAPDADVPVRFAFLSCQDYSGHYFNALARLAEEEIDFFVHLGDYIYETTGDASFQDTAAGRTVTLTDTAGAIAFEREDGSVDYAASSIDNYREIYRIYRSDPALQRVHERAPMIAVWDDHEFSDDCWGATATYRDGEVDETDPARRQRASRAWFEYMPVDYPDPEFVYDFAAQPPDDIRIWRDLRFGRHVHLVMTDLRTHRSDHLVAEDAYPGAVVMDEATLEATGGVPDWASPYVDIETYADGAYATVLREAAMAAGYPAERITGNVSTVWIASVLEDAGSDVPPIPDEDLATLPRGLAMHHMTKLGLYTSIGSRYLVTAEPWRRFAAWRWSESDGASEVAMGEAQEAWFLETMKGSVATWKVWGNEYCLTQLDIDLRALPIPDTFKQLFSLTAEDWNGMPNRRAKIIDELAAVPNVVAVTGDIHAFYASTPFAAGPGSSSLVEFVGGAVSSTAYQTLLERQVANDPLLSTTPGADSLAGAIRDLLVSGPNPHLGFAATKDHGFAIAEVDGAAFTVTMFITPEENVATESYDDPALASMFSTERFKVDAGSRALWRDFDGVWRQWDPGSNAWV